MDIHKNESENGVVCWEGLKILRINAWNGDQLVMEYEPIRKASTLWLTGLCRARRQGLCDIDS